MSSEPKIYDLETYQPANCVGQLMYRVKAAHMSALDEALAQHPDLAPLEISAAQYVTISVLAKCGEDSAAAQICKDLSYDAGAMTRMVDRLEAKGLISRCRCPEDRRLVKIKLTEAGLTNCVNVRFKCSITSCAASATRKRASSKVFSSGCCKTPDIFLFKYLPRHTRLRHRPLRQGSGER